MDLSNFRKDYTAFQLDEDSILPNPFLQFKRWFQDCLNKNVMEPNAFVLSTSHDNKPSSRVLLLKRFDENAMVFYSNYNSRKGKELMSNPNASMLFFWHEMQRQVRIEGIVRKGDETEANEYFNSRPLESRVGALASNQSEIIANRKVLEDKVASIDVNHITKPDNWGGYELIPHYFEFWQGRASRLHDRISYSKKNEKWEIHRLAP